MSVNNFSDILRFVFGPTLYDNSGPSSGFQNDFRNPIWNVDEDDDTDDELYHESRADGHPEGFQMYSDPNEMHRFFEQQMNDVFKSFGSIMGIFGGLHPPGHGNAFSLPQLDTPASGGSIRDEYLKPGYRSPSSSDPQNNADSDLDGKIVSEDLNKLLDQGIAKIPNTEQPSDSIQTWTNSPKGSPSFYSRSIITRSIVKPDGTTETQRTVRDSRGLEETTVTTTQKDDGAGNTYSGNQSQNSQKDSSLWEKLFGKF